MRTEKLTEAGVGLGTAWSKTSFSSDGPSHALFLNLLLLSQLFHFQMTLSF